MIARVRGVIAAVIAARSIRQAGGASGTETGTPPARRTMGA